MLVVVAVQPVPLFESVLLRYPLGSGNPSYTGQKACAYRVKWFLL